MTDNDRTAQLERACSYLRRIPAWYLATTDVADGYQPRVRPFSFAMVDDGKLWFCTSRDKDVWAELSANPKFELSGWKPGECWIVLTGEAALEDDAVASDKVRQAGFKHMVGIGEEHESANDGRLAFFSVRNIAARFCDIDGAFVNEFGVVGDQAVLGLTENLIQHRHGDKAAVNQFAEHIPGAYTGKLIRVSDKNDPCSTFDA